MSRTLRRIMIGVLTWSLCSSAGAQIAFQATIDQAQEVPPSGSSGTGTAEVLLDATGSMLRVQMAFTGLTGNQTAAHIHGPAAPGTNGPVVLSLSLSTQSSEGTLDQTYDLSGFPNFQLNDLRAGLYYINIHSTTSPGGEIRGQVTTNVQLDGGQEVPPVITEGRGGATVYLSADESALTVDLEFSGLQGSQSAAHLHGPAAAGSSAGVVLNLGLSTGAAQGGLHETYTLASFPSFDLATFKDNLYYLNVHSTAHPGGEIRGQVIYCDAADDDLQIVGQSISDTQLFRACETITVRDSTVQSPGGVAAFRALRSVSLDAGFSVAAGAVASFEVGFPLRRFAP